MNAPKPITEDQLSVFADQLSAPQSYDSEDESRCSANAETTSRTKAYLMLAFGLGQVSGGSVGPFFTTGSLTVTAGAIRSAIPVDGEDALTVALKMVAAANRIVAAAKNLGLAKALDI